MNLLNASLHFFLQLLIDIELHSLDSYSDDNNILIVKTKKVLEGISILYKPLFNSGLQKFKWK